MAKTAAELARSRLQVLAKAAAVDPVRRMLIEAEVEICRPRPPVVVVLEASRLMLPDAPLLPCTVPEACRPVRAEEPWRLSTRLARLLLKLLGDGESAAPAAVLSLTRDTLATAAAAAAEAQAPIPAPRALTDGCGT